MESHYSNSTVPSYKTNAHLIEFRKMENINERIEELKRGVGVLSGVVDKAEMSIVLSKYKNWMADKAYLGNNNKK